MKMETMDYKKDDVALMRYDLRTRTILIGGGAAKKVNGLLSAILSETMGDNQRLIVPDSMNLSGGSEGGEFSCHVRYNFAMGEAYRAINIEPIIRKLQEQAKSDGITLVVQEGLRYNRVRIRQYVDAILHNAHSQTGQMNELEQRVKGAKKGEGEYDVSVLDNIPVLEGALGSIRELPESPGIYAARLVLPSFRDEYRGGAAADNLITADELQAVHAANMRKYCALRTAIVQKLGELKESPEYIELVAAKEKSHQESESARKTGNGRMPDSWANRLKQLFEKS